MNSVSAKARFEAPSLRVLSQCGRHLAEKRMLLDVKCGSMVRRFGNFITFSVNEEERCYFRTKNLKSGFRNVPKENAAIEISDNIVGLRIDFDLHLSGNGRVILHILAFSENERIASLRTSYAPNTTNSSTQSRRNVIDLPPGTTKIGYAIRLQGEGRFLDAPIRVFLLTRSQLKSELDLPRSHQEKLDISLTQLTKTPDNVVSNDQQKNVFSHLLSDNRPHIRRITKEYLEQNPNEENDIGSFFISLRKSRRSLIALEILESYGVYLSEIRHQLYMDTLNQLLRMSEISEYYEKLDFETQQKPPILRRYIAALSWTGRDDELIALLKELIRQPNIVRGMIPSLIRYSELLDPEDLRIVTQIVLNQKIRHLNPLHVINLYDQLSSRNMGPTASRLDHILETYESSQDLALKVNLYIFKANLAFHANLPGEQLRYINMALAQTGLNEISVIDPAKFLSADNVRASTTQNDILIEEGTTEPLVTVIMTTYNSTETLKYAIESILGQTHYAIELIVVDDASSDGTPKMIRDLAETDPRIRPILLTTNGGTYIAKNHGRMVASGKYVTCHDSDDWAHPQKIERLVRVLEENEDVIGVEGGHIRISPDSGSQRRISGGLKPDASSLMYRNTPVTEAIGFYDGVRAGADGEFKYRLQKYFGIETVVFLRELLSIVKWAEGTLSGKGSAFEISYLGVFADARLRYRHKFEKSHEYDVLKHGTSALYMPPPVGTLTENEGL